LRYRRAYGEASNLLEASKYDHSYGRAYAGKVGGQAERILAEVLERLGHDHRDVIEEAVLDALSGRRPQW
jgi:hypothetical protein